MTKTTATATAAPTIQTMKTERVKSGQDMGILVESRRKDDGGTEHRLIDTVRKIYATDPMPAKDLVVLLKTMGYTIKPGSGSDRRWSLCDPASTAPCSNPMVAGNPEGHSSITCYVRYTDLGFEPGETYLTFEEWARD
jgi:hypothetical protein